MASAGTIDPSKPGRFPVVLGDSILNPQAPKDVYTGIRYNHKPSLSTPIAPTTARLKPSASTSSSTGSGTGAPTFDLSFSDDGSKYMYTGQRTADSSQYVLTFDAARQVFVLDRVDSMFHMNLSQTPSNGDADQLQREFPHLDIADSAIPIKADGRSGTAAPIPASVNNKPGVGEAAVKKEPRASAAAGGAGKKKKAPTQRGKAVLSADVIRPGDSDDDDGNGVVVVKDSTPAPPPPKKPAPRKRQQQVAKKPVEAAAIALPTAPPPEPKPAPKKAKNPEPNSDEDEDSDDDDLLEIEYPGGKPPSSRAGLGFEATAVPAIASRRFSELLEVEQHPAGEHFGGSDRDADGDADEEEEFDFEAQDEEEESLGSGRFQLPSPVRGQQAPGHEQAAGGYEEDMDAEGDLEAALMAGLEAGEDSDVSEEE